MTPTIPAVRAAILGQLQLALNAGIGNLTPVPISDYWRWFFDPDVFFSLFQRIDTSEINGWEFDYEGFETEEDEERFRFFTVLNWKLIGYYGVKDSGASSKKLSDQIETIQSAFNLNATVFGTPERVERAPRTIISATRARMEKGQHNCWYAEMALRTEHVEIKS